MSGTVELGSCVMSPLCKGQLRVNWFFRVMRQKVDFLAMSLRSSFDAHDHRDGSQQQAVEVRREQHECRKISPSFNLEQNLTQSARETP